MTIGTVYMANAQSQGTRPDALRATDWLSLGAAPTLALMAVLTGTFGAGGHAMSCSAAPHAWVLAGMGPMYVLMSAFHFGPWLKLISGWRSGGSPASPAHDCDM
jgi:hypothetical protein